MSKLKRGGPRWRRHLLVWVVGIVAVLAGAPPAAAREAEPSDPMSYDPGDGLVFHVTPAWFEEDGYPPSGLYRDGEAVYLLELESLWSPCFAADGMAFVHSDNEWWGDGTWMRVFRYGRGWKSLDVRAMFADGGTALDEQWGGDMWGPTWYRDWSCDSEAGTLTFTTVEGTMITVDPATATVTGLPGATEDRALDTRGGSLLANCPENPALLVWAGALVAVGLGAGLLALRLRSPKAGPQ
ncbi:MAG: hypothetical protein FWG11_07795 [Promicromonosporaceae bacterium]|nr:hypothetical protein [Promicromonosporaceae bacterium]